MSERKHNATVVRLDEGTRGLLTLMHFGPIPEEAKYVAFFEDGLAQYFETLDVPFLLGFNSTMTIVSFMTDATLEF